MISNKIIIYYAIFLQLITAIFIFSSAIPIRVASLGIFYNIFRNYYLGALLMFGAVILALIGILLNNLSYNKLSFLFFLPQYAFLLLTAGSSFNYIIQQQYADGVMRSWQFIFLDQLPSLVIVILYTIGIFDFRKVKYAT